MPRTRRRTWSPPGEFLGLFARSTEEGTDLYFQFLGQIAYKISEEEGALVLRVRAGRRPDIDQYHVKVPYNEENLAVTAESGLQPPCARTASTSTT